MSDDERVVTVMDGDEEDEDGRRKSQGRISSVFKTTGKGVVKGTKIVGKGAVSLPGKTVKGVGVVGKGVGKGTVTGAKVAGKGVKALPGAVGKGTVTGAKLGVKGVRLLPTATIKGARLGARGVTALPSTTVKGVRLGARLGVKGIINLPSLTVTGASAGVRGIIALPGAVTRLPGAVTNLPGQVVTGAVKGVKAIGGKRPLVRQDSSQAWKSRMTSPVSSLDLILECHGLPKKDSFSQADAFCVLWEAPPGYTGNSSTKGKPSRLPSRQETEVGHTEIVSDCNPQFSTTFRLQFNFEKEQTYVVRVYDKDLKFANDLKEHDYLGGVVFTLGQLMGGEGNTIARPLGYGKSYLLVTGKEMLEAREFFEFRFSAEELFSNHDVLDITAPYFKIETLQDDDQTWDVVWKSEVIKDDANPTWKEAQLPLQMLITDNQETDRLLKISLWDYAKNMQHESLGFVHVTIDDLVKGSMRGIPVYDVMREKMRLFRGNKLKKAGCLKVLKAKVSIAPSMLQYISGGCEIDLTVAVDFTRKNGKLHQEDGLHYRSGHWLNDYQAAIHKVGTIVEPYSKKKQFAILGFGAQVRGYNTNTNGTFDANKWYFPMAERAIGGDGLLKAYDNTLDNKDSLIQAKVANIRPVVQAAVYRAIRISQKRHCYCILCILTAGKIADIQEVSVDIVTAAEDAPISIVFIGVGESGVLGDDGDTMDAATQQAAAAASQYAMSAFNIPGGVAAGVGNVADFATGVVNNIGDAFAGMGIHNGNYVRAFDNFADLERLCDDARGRKEYASSKLLNSNGVPIGRNILNFSKFEDNDFNCAKVVAEALQDIPEQVVQYFTTNGVPPKPPLPPPDFTKDSLYNNNNGNNANRKNGSSKDKEKRKQNKQQPKQ